MEICRFLRTTLILFFLFLPFQTIAEDQLTKTKINALDFTLLKYVLFLYKNLQRLFGGGWLVNPIISYEHVDYNVKYKEDNYFYDYSTSHTLVNPSEHRFIHDDLDNILTILYLASIFILFNLFILKLFINWVKNLILGKLSPLNK